MHAEEKACEKETGEASSAEETYLQFRESILRQLCIGLGVPAEILEGDYSSARFEIGINSFPADPNAVAYFNDFC